MRDDRVAARRPLAESGAWGRGLLRRLDRALLGSVRQALGPGAVGCLRLELPSGEVALLGSPEDTPNALVVVKRYRALWRLLRGGSLGFAECYMAGDLEAQDLAGVFEFYVANEAMLTAAVPAIEVTPGNDRRWHAGRRNTRAGSRRNIAAHYDIGNDFYRLWLDADMLYSSGIFSSPDASLEEAQRAKLDRVLAALELSAGNRLLEIGCGWGALACAAAERGARVDAITISREQLDAARRRVAQAGLDNSVDVRFEDYRDTTATFDRLVSIEMIEAVGEENWPLYFSTIADRLAPGGVAVIQAITIREDVFERYRQNPDFIQRYIFPGGMLPTIPLMERRALASGLSFETVELFGRSYAETLRHWRQRFGAAWPRIAALGLDDRFKRMWLYYLTYCEVGFEHGLIDVGLYRMRKAT